MSEIAQRQYVSILLEPVVCCNCGIAFGISSTFEEKRREDHLTFYCPNGHSQYYPRASKIEKLQKELDMEKKRTEWAKTDARYSENRRRAAVGQLTKVKNRIKNGVCPCCNRTFKNLSRHMGTKHPDYVVANQENK